MLNSNQIKLFIETARGISEETWKKFNQLEKDAYIKKHPTSKYAIKEQEDKPNKVFNDDLFYSFKSLTTLKDLDLPEKVMGDFYCHLNHLTTLEGSPKEVGGDFDCSKNNLTTLVGCPEKVGGSFSCSWNKLTSLEGCPKEVGENFYCFYNDLTSLEGCPKEVGGHFGCAENELTTLEGAPEKVGRDFHCEGNKLTSLEGCPKEVGGDFVIDKFCGFTEEDIRKVCNVKGEVIFR